MREISREQKRFLALDVGDLNLKFALCEGTRQNLRAVVWGKEELNVIFWKRPLERIWPTLERFYLSWKVGEAEKAEGVLLTLSPRVFKAALQDVGRIRKIPKEKISAKEEEEIIREAIAEAEEKMRSSLFLAKGIRNEDFTLAHWEFLRKTIDGYEVSHLEGFEGSELEFQIFATFLPVGFLQTIRVLSLQHKLGEPLFAHEALLVREFAREKGKDALFIDIGDKITLLVVVREGELAFIDTVSWGGDSLTLPIEGTLGLRDNSAREFKEEYAKGMLSEGVRKKVEGLFLPEMKNAGTLIQESLKKVGGALPPNVFLFGGSAQLQDLLELFKTDLPQNLSFFDTPKVAVLLPKDVAAIENFNQASNSLYTPLFLESYATRKENS